MLPSQTHGSNTSLIANSTNQQRTPKRTWTSNCTSLESCWIVQNLMTAAKKVKKSMSHQLKWGYRSLNHLCADKEPPTCQRWYITTTQKDAEIRAAKARRTWGVPNARCFSALPKRENTSRSITPKQVKQSRMTINFNLFFMLNWLLD